MANNYSIVTAEDLIPCGSEDGKLLEQIFSMDGPDYHGLSAEYCADYGGVFIFAEECGNVDELPEHALAMIGKLLKKANLPYIEFGVAFTCDKIRPGSHGGTRFRIDDEGRIVDPILTWPSKRNQD